jgi:hypothetical protein
MIFYNNVTYPLTHCNQLRYEFPASFLKNPIFSIR